MIVTSRRRRSEPQILVLGVPIGYAPPLDEAHSEYPKFLQFPKKVSVIVNNAEEERAALSGVELKTREAPIVLNEAPVPTLQGSNNEMDMLLKIAAARGISINPRWSLRKVRKMLEKAFHGYQESQWP